MSCGQADFASLRRRQVFYDDLISALDALAFPEYSLVGEGSFGTRTALHVAMHRPAKVRRVRDSERP